MWVDNWLEILSFDAPLVLLAIFFYLFYIIRKHKKYNVESFLYKIGNFGDEFYERFISLFHGKKTIFMGISGILVLHLLTDFGNFIIPAVTGFFHPMYFEQLDMSLHQNIYNLMLADLGTNLINSILFFITYILNIVASSDKAGIDDVNFLNARKI